jgi:CHAT domain-containing protein
VADPEYGAGGGEGFDGGTRGVVLASASRPGTIDAAEGRSLPSLPFSRVEATAVAGLVSEKERTLRLGLDANLRSLAPGSALEQARFVLLSSHGRADEEERSACGLWLSPSAPGRGAAFFPASELASRTMRADFVVLSACSTNRGRISEEEGVLSLAREFLRAGARAVLASEWLVEDASAAAVSIAFHEGVLRDGLPAGEALRRAKVRFLREAKLPVSEAARGSDPPRPRSALDPHHPFFWAPFLLFGPAS